MENADEQRQDSVEDCAPLSAGLYFAATPIGTAADITLRVLDTLRRADILVAEDTRVLRRLMEIHSVPLAGRPLISYHDRNGPEARPKILRLLAEGKSVVYASDAGTPLVADPGFRLAEEAREAGATIVSLPGPSAVLVALLASGLPTDAFAFCGFPPPKSGKRRKWLAHWRSTPGTLLFFESPRRLAETLADMGAALGDRPAAVMRELTKRFEETRRGMLLELAETYAAMEPPKGEAVIAVGPAPANLDQAGPQEIDHALEELMRLESLKDAVRTVAEQTGAPRKLVYDRAIALRAQMAEAEAQNDDGEPEEK
ncbi:MAG: 16S rRNA (cytidine(1402)-2'-O)-methyltransferase [Neomegalonema sp.]|nr:16S rRNA (cytidine(1402)-2'-O)-methyltransferase [Neomegalonema sp.]